MNNYSLPILLLVLFPLFSWGQDQSILDQYIDEALASNITLKERQLSYERSLAALKEARAMFFPEVRLQARYSVATGGRAFELPIGDLMNPVYDNLNLVNQVNAVAVPDYPEVPNFPAIENQQINFLRPTEQETFLRLNMPIFNALIQKNHQLRKSLTEVDRISVDIYKQELIREVRTAFYNYQKALQAIDIYNNAEQLVAENLRTSQSLYKNEMATIDVVYAAEAEVKRVAQQSAEAEKQEAIAKAYFNFLLNRRYDSAITPESLNGFDSEGVVSLDQAQGMALQYRQELKQMDQVLQVRANQENLAKADRMPQLNLQADYGVQGNGYNLDRESDFGLASAVLSVPLFQPKTKHKVQQAKIDQQIALQQQENLRQQIGLQVVEAYYDLQAAMKNVDLAKSEVESTAKAYRLVNTKFKNNLANNVELVDARTRKTNAQENLLIARFDYKVKLATLQYTIGQHQF
ncbi:MAG: TolC family protein [Bacteroidota bacterium]